MFDRRQFAQAVLAVSASAGLGCSQAVKPAAKTISKVGIQTYTLRAMFEENPAATFKMIKDVGYDYVELNSRNFTQLTPDALKALMDQSGLKAPASHISMDMINGDLTPLVETSKTLGLKYVIIPWIDENARSLDDWKGHAKLMNEAGRKLADNGIRLAYHNHQFEFIDLGGGTTAMDVLLNDSRSENLDFELDFFWSYLADADVPGLFKAHPGRFKLCHIKDMGGNKADFTGKKYEEISTGLMKNVGEGIIPFESYFALNDVSGMEYFIAEHDNPQKPYDAAIATSLKSIRNFKF